MSKRIEELEKEIEKMEKLNKESSNEFSYEIRLDYLKETKAKLEERKLAEEEFGKMIDELQRVNNAWRNGIYSQEVMDFVFFTDKNIEELKQKLNQGEGK